MVPVFIVSSRAYTGKTFLALGLAFNLREQGYTVGYMKPIGKIPIKKGKEVYAADAVFMKEALSLPEPLNVISPFVLSYETHQLLLEGRIGNVKEQIREALEIQSSKDIVMIGGAGDLFQGATLNIDALSLISELNCPALMVESWNGDTSLDTLIGGYRLLGNRFAGCIINKVPITITSHVKEAVKPFLERMGVNVLGVFPKDSILESISVRQLAEILNGKILCCDDRLDDFVEQFSVGAMDVDSALTYFRRTPNKAVITGSHRSDIQLAAIETSTKCIILTGGLFVNDLVLGKAQAKGIPIISVHSDTFKTIEKIESVIGKIGIREEKKVTRIREVTEDFDYARLLNTLKVQK
ncbi:MAG TPA: cobyrinic acid a,c-diamide synthase [Nitrospiraceae bacterium]|jgi:BioD-like phosphotransacetylase family protein|nr:cobyrinic acid a,c-diamide synthase [Nitrospiraceae bacterium]